MWLIVGLGNPGAEYDGTRHNVGFQVIDLLAERHRFGPLKSFKSAAVAKGAIAGVEVLLVKPMTYMNLSGDAVGAIASYYKVEPAQVLVIHDELDFPPGEVRLKAGGGHGGHNGLRSLMAHIGRDFPRLRLGIGKPADKDRGADFVLSRFSKGERQVLDEAVGLAADAVETLLRDGLHKTMQVVNQRQ